MTFEQMAATLLIVALRVALLAGWVLMAGAFLWSVWVIWKHLWRRD